MSAAPAAPAEEGDVVQAVFAGLEVLIPLLAADPALLRFPKLARGYFTLLALLLEAHPRAVSALHSRRGTPEGLRLTPRA